MITTPTSNDSTDWIHECEIQKCEERILPLALELCTQDASAETGDKT